MSYDNDTLAPSRHVVKDDLIWDKDKHRSDQVLFSSVKFKW